MGPLLVEVRSVLFTVMYLLLRRLVRYGKGFHPLGQPAPEELERLRAALAEAGRDPGELELVGRVRGRFPAADSVADLDEARAAWKQAVRDSHPDRMIARGVPEEAVKLAEKRLIAINEAWEEISSRQAA